MKVLFVDDQPKLIQTTVLDNLPNDIEHTVCDFDDVQNKLIRFCPDIVVLDLRRDHSESGQGDGTDSFNTIWKHRFRPVIVFSAYPEMLKDSRPEHPFVKYVIKDASGLKNLQTSIQELSLQVQAILDAEKEIDNQVSIALRDVAPVIYDQFNQPSARSEAILRAAQRRIAAMIDETSLRPSSLKPWEQYIFPPVVTGLITGDVIKRKGSDGSNAGDFGIVLTPSCDLVCSGSRKPKVNSVLVVMGKSVSDVCVSLSLSSKEKRRLEQLEEIVGNLNSSMFFLPEIPSKMPHICINLKELSMIPIEELSGNTPSYDRIASIDSPFREEIVWFLIQTIGRPGVPDRDKAEWAKSVGALASNTPS